MTLLPPRSTHRSLALFVALLALCAQMWAGQVSTAHLGQMLLQAQWGDVCTAQTASQHTGGAPENPQGHTMGNAFSCPVCTVAGVGIAPGNAPLVVACQHAGAPSPDRCARIPAPAQQHAYARPPAQAPPAA